MTGSPLTAIRSAWNSSLIATGSTAGAGVDLVEIAGLADLLAAGGKAFLDSGWSSQEQIDAGGSVERLGARWAAKEAVMKALRCGIGDLDPLDIEILTNDDGSPHVVLHRSALAASSSLRLVDCHVSLSHEEGWAVAIAVAIREPVVVVPPQTQKGL